jgi:glutathione peroxidase
MKTALLVSLLSLFLTDTSIYDFKANDVEGEKQINFASFKGKKILIVNIACKSPYAFQLREMQELYSAYREKLVVVAFPAGDDYGGQELKNNSEIRDFCRYSQGLTFPITEKTSTTGTMRHPVYSFLIEKAKEQDIAQPVQGNFTKFLLDEKGQLIKVFPPDVTPLSVEITSILNNTNNWSLE